jgi:hypothetical protein
MLRGHIPYTQQSEAERYDRVCTHSAIVAPSGSRTRAGGRGAFSALRRGAERAGGAYIVLMAIPSSFFLLFPFFFFKCRGALLGRMGARE